MTVVEEDEEEKDEALTAASIYKLDNQGIMVQFLAQERHFFLLKTSRLSPRPMLLLLQWILGLSS
jgi:hypothetical protein